MGQRRSSLINPLRFDDRRVMTYEPSICNVHQLEIRTGLGAAAMDDGPPGILFIGIGCRGAVARALQVWYCLDTEPGFPTDSRDQLTDVRVPGWFVTLQSVFDRRP
jgi:hypothetical protein